jgi:hypothetical protein
MCWRCRKTLFELFAEGVRRGLFTEEQIIEAMTILCKPDEEERKRLADLAAERLSYASHEIEAEGGSGAAST